jgi:NADH-quinone oxidoreductase subunit C
MDATPILDVLRAAVPAAAIDPVATAIDMPTLRIDRADVLAVMGALRDDPALQFSFLVDVTVVDLLPAVPRFEVVYHLACLGPAYATGTPAPARRLRIKVALPGDDPRVATITGLYPAAGWLEREAFDLFGITFEHHPDLRRLLTPEDWTGHPLRKDYPVQIRKTPQSWSPIQLTVEEFAENMRAQRQKSDAQSGDTGRSRE